MHRQQTYVFAENKDNGLKDVEVQACLIGTEKGRQRFDGQLNTVGRLRLTAVVTAVFVTSRLIGGHISQRDAFRMYATRNGHAAAQADEQERKDSGGQYAADAT